MTPSKNSDRLKLNLGCGYKHLDGWLNVDSVPECNPDLLIDLEQVPWVWADNSVDEVKLIHVLEHLGESSKTYLAIIKELYRVCAPDAVIDIHVPHPRHDHFIIDPTHVRPILPEGLQMFDQAKNREWLENGFANTPLGLQVGVDFRILECQYVLDSGFRERLDNGQIQDSQIRELMRTHFNVCSEIKIKWQVVKENRT